MYVYSGEKEKYVIEPSWLEIPQTVRSGLGRCSSMLSAVSLHRVLDVATAGAPDGSEVSHVAVAATATYDVLLVSCFNWPGLTATVIPHSDDPVVTVTMPLEDSSAVTALALSPGGESALVRRLGCV